MELVKLQKSNGIGEVIINSPPANAMGRDTLIQLGDVVNELKNDSSTRVVVLRSGHPKIFVAGADLGFMLSLDEDGFRQYMEMGQTVYNEFESLRQPSIAVINGYALGGGCELALCCDFRFISKAARIGLPEVTLGIQPGWGGTQRLPRLVGLAKARELLLLGKTMSGEEAFNIGLVDKVLEPEELLEESVRFARDLATKATAAIGKIKECLKSSSQESMMVGLQKEVEGITYLFANTEDAREGISAFNEKRPPKYSGR